MQFVHAMFEPGEYFRFRLVFQQEGVRQEPTFRCMRTFLDVTKLAVGLLSLMKSA